MTTYLRTVKATLIIGFILVGTLFTSSLLSPYSTTASAKLITYPALITIEIDNSSYDALNTPVGIESTLHIKLKIGYSFAGPENLLALGMIGRLWVFGSFIVFPQQIHLTITEKPDWANIYLVTPDIYIDSPEITASYAYADVVISPYQNAPAQPYAIGVSAYAKPLGRIGDVNFSTTLNFVPEFIPLISVEVDNPVRQVGPREPVNFDVTIKNLGNKEIIVTGVIKDELAEWAPLISPTETIIPPAGEAKMTFSVIAPYNFGWHSEQRTFTVFFTPEKSPPTVPPTTGTLHSIQVRVNNIGFSAPGFEPILLFAALIVVAIILKKRKKT